MRLGINLLERHRFTAIAIENTVGRLVVNMNYLRFGNISDLITLVLHPFRPRQILQPGQRFIVGILCPQIFANRSIGIVTKSSGLIRLADIWIPLLKNLLLGILCRVGSALFAICESYAILFKWTQQTLQPIWIERKDMCTGDDD